MHPRYVPIDPELLKRLYVDERLTAAEIAARFSCSEITILRRLRRLGIPARPRGPRPGMRPEARQGALPPFGWGADVAWAVGIIATDGNLSRTRWSLSVASKDTDLLETVRRCLHLTNAITPYTNSRCYHIQWRDRRLYDWLVGIGLTPAKSLTLGPLTVPDEYFSDFFRGCLDGDGSVLIYTDRYNTAKKERYVYERLYVSLVSASRPFLDWIRARIRLLLRVNGVIDEQRKRGHRSIWRLRYAKAESIRVLGWNILLAKRSLPFPQARQSRALSLPIGLQPPSSDRQAEGWMAVQ